MPMMRIALFSLRLCCLAGALSFDLATAQTAEPQPAQSEARIDDARAWHVQKLLVPADHPDEWPRSQSDRYLPMAADEFEARLAQLRQSSEATAQPQTARLLRADYSAEFTSENVLRGTLAWKFDNQTSEALPVRLGDCRISLGNLSWAIQNSSSSGSDKSPSTTTAIVGNDQHGQLVAMVPHSGTIQGNWSIYGSSDPSGSIVFPLQLPYCTNTELQLTLPQDLTPSVDGAVVSPISADGKKSTGRFS